MDDFGPLLARLIARAAQDEPRSLLGGRSGALPAPLSAEELERAERELGFALHPLLAAVFRHVADGGFGPAYQLFSLVAGPTAEQAVDVYLAQRRDGAGTRWAWPEGVLPVLSWGCGMLACIDCRSEHGTVLLFEPNPGDPALAWYVDAVSLEAWFEHYIGRTGWWERTGDGEDPGRLPWPDWKARTTMGYWDTTPFGNDHAADFADALDDATPQQRTDLVGAALERIATADPGEDLDHFDAPRAVAAAALVAAQCPDGRPVADTDGPSSAMPQFPTYLRRLAVDALDRLTTPPSWIAEEWNDDGRAWRRSIAELRDVLEPPQHETLFDFS